MTPLEAELRLSIIHAQLVQIAAELAPRAAEVARRAARMLTLVKQPHVGPLTEDGEDVHELDAERGMREERSG